MLNVFLIILVVFTMCIRQRLCCTYCFCSSCYCNAKCLWFFALPFLAVESHNKSLFCLFYLIRRCLVTQIGSIFSGVRIKVGSVFKDNKMCVTFTFHWCDMCLCSKRGTVILIHRLLLNSVSSTLLNQLLLISIFVLSYGLLKASSFFS